MPDNACLPNKVHCTLPFYLTPLSFQDLYGNYLKAMPFHENRLMMWKIDSKEWIQYTLAYMGPSSASRSTTTMFYPSPGK